MLRAAALSFILAMFSLVLSTPVLASPPLAGSEDYDELMPYTEWITGQASNKGGLCCSISDCRVVSWRTTDTGYEAFIAKLDDRGFVKFLGAPNAWLSVPADVIKRNVNPTGRAIACWSAHHADDAGYYCFFVPDLT